MTSFFFLSLFKKVMAANIEETDKNPAEILEYAIENYHHFCIDFLKALLDKYENTEYESIFRETQLKYDIAITHNSDQLDKDTKKEDLVREFYLQLQPHFAEINKGNVKSITDVKFVKDLGLDKILALDDPDTNDAVSEYLKNMIQAAVMWSVYKNIPKNLLKSIGSAASSIENGKKDIDMRDVSKSILQDVNHEDIQQFALNMVNDPKSLNDLCQLAASSLNKK